MPFPGAAPILSSTAAGHTLVAYIGLPPATPFIKEGTLQALAVTSLKWDSSLTAVRPRGARPDPKNEP